MNPVPARSEPLNAASADKQSVLSLQRKPLNPIELTIDYKKETPSNWAIAASTWRWSKDETSNEYVLRFHCPRCFHANKVALPIALVAHGLESLGSVDDTLVIECECNGSHSGAPSGQRGCGAYGRVFRPDVKNIANTNDLADPISSLEMKWKSIAEEEYLKSLASSRASAGRLAASITAITSLLGTVLLFISPDAVRNTAHIYRVISEIALMLSAVLAVFAAAVASKAARARPMLGLVHGAGSRKSHEEGVRRIARQTGIASWTAILAVALLLSSALLVMFSPAADNSHSYLLIDKEGYIVCASIDHQILVTNISDPAEGPATPRSFAGSTVLASIDHC